MDGGAVPLKDAAILSKTDCGYRYRAGQQNSHLVVTRVKNGLRFADTRTARFERLAPACRKIRGVKVGIAAVCKVRGTVTARRPLLIEVWPRLGDDFVDGSSLPNTFAMAVLGDAGNDVALLGAGPDFFTGAYGRDHVVGGAGDDWIRTGDDSDHVRGGAGNDYLVGGYGRDSLTGDTGVDQIFCGDGADRAKTVRARPAILVAVPVVRSAKFPLAPATAATVAATLAMVVAGRLAAAARGAAMEAALVRAEAPAAATPTTGREMVA